MDKSQSAEEQRAEELIGKFELAVRGQCASLALEPGSAHAAQMAAEVAAQREALVAAVLCAKGGYNLKRNDDGVEREFGTQKESLLSLLETFDWFSVMEAVDMGVPGEPTSISASLRSMRGGGRKGMGLPIVGVRGADGVYRYRLLRQGEDPEAAIKAGAWLDRRPVEGK